MDVLIALVTSALVIAVTKFEREGFKFNKFRKIRGMTD